MDEVHSAASTSPEHNYSASLREINNANIFYGALFEIRSARYAKAIALKEAEKGGQLTQDETNAIKQEIIKANKEEAEDSAKAKVAWRSELLEQRILEAKKGEAELSSEKIVEIMTNVDSAIYAIPDGDIAPNYTLLPFMESKFFIDLFLKNTGMVPFYEPALDRTEEAANQPSQVGGLLAKAIQRDIASHAGDTAVLDYMLQNHRCCGVGAADLGALLEINPDPNAKFAETWAAGETLFLISEESGYDVAAFVDLHKKLSQDPFFASHYPGGLTNPALFANGCEVLKDSALVSEEEYIGLQKFMAMTYWFVKDQEGFAKGRIGIAQHYTMEPLLALQEVTKNLGMVEEQAFVTQTLSNYQSKFCIEGEDGEKRLNRAALEGVRRFTEVCQDPAKLCGTILEVLTSRFGNLNDFGYTVGDANDQTSVKGVSTQFLEEQNNQLVDSRIWV